MGYCIEMIESDFVVRKDNFGKALESLKSVFVPENMTCKDYVSGKEYPHFSWVDTKTVIESNTLEEAMKEIRYNPMYNADGDIYGLEFTGEKYGDEEVFFNALAPYVEYNSQLSFEGEDGATWKWIFKDGKVEQI